jgi:hypothetical protein
MCRTFITGTATGFCPDHAGTGAEARGLLIKRAPRRAHRAAFGETEMKRSLLLAAMLASATQPGWSATSEASSGAIADGTSSTSSSNGSATLRGTNGSVVVNGDQVQVRGGELTVNGTPYGRVDANAVVKYSVNNGAKQVTVNNVERKPLP